MKNIHTQFIYGTCFCDACLFSHRNFCETFSILEKFSGKPNFVIPKIFSLQNKTDYLTPLHSSPSKMTENGVRTFFSHLVSESVFIMSSLFIVFPNSLSCSN